MEPTQPKLTMIERGQVERPKQADQLRRDEQQRRADAASKLRAIPPSVPGGKEPPAAD